MENPHNSDEVRGYLSLLRRWLLLLIAMPLLTAAVAYLISKRSTPLYEASATYLVNEALATQTIDYSALQASERLARTYAELMTKQPVLEAVIDRLNLDSGPLELKKFINARPIRETQLILVVVENQDPQRAAQIANLLGVVFAEQNQALQASRFAASKLSLEAELRQLDDQIKHTLDHLSQLDDSPADQASRDRLDLTLAQYRQTYASLLQSYEQVRVAEAQATSNLVQAEAAIPPSRPVKPATLNNTAIAALLGLIAGIGFAFLFEYLDDTLHSPEQVTLILDMPVLGLIGRYEPGDSDLMAVIHPRAPVSEAFRSLRTNIEFASVERPVRYILVTSPSPEDGKSTVAANLAVVMAQSGRRVALLDADLRRPKIHQVFRLTNRKGLAELFLQMQSYQGGRFDLGRTLQHTEIPSLKIITSGGLPPNPAELLASDRMKAILNLVAESHEVVILDSPPILVVTDAAVLAPRVDGVLLVIKPGVTKIAASKQAVEQLRLVGANLLGVVLNDVEPKRLRNYYYHQYRNYDYAQSQS